MGSSDNTAGPSLNALNSTTLHPPPQMYFKQQSLHGTKLLTLDALLALFDNSIIFAKESFLMFATGFNPERLHI